MSSDHDSQGSGPSAPPPKQETRWWAERSGALEELAGVGFLELNLATGALTLSPGARFLHGLQPEDDILGPELMARAIPEVDLARVSAGLEAAARGVPYDLDHRVIDRDGRQRWVHARARLRRDDQGQPVSLLGAVVDITETVEQRERDQRLSGFLRGIRSVGKLIAEAESLPELLEGSVEFLVEALGASLIWMAVQTPSGMRYEALSGPAADQEPAAERDRLRALPACAARHLAEEQAVLVRVEELCADCPFGEALCAGALVGRLLHQGRSYGTVGFIGPAGASRSSEELDLLAEIAREIAAAIERFELGTQLRHAQKLEAIGRLAGGVAHDFNNLLTVMEGGLTFAEEMLGPAHPAAPDLESVHEATRRAASLTRQLLTFSRKQEMAPRPTDLNAVVAGMQSMLARLVEPEISLEAELHPALPPAMVDPAQMEQVIANLVVNARDAMPRGGRIAVRTGSGGAPLPSAGLHVLLEVADEGEGMSPETQAMIFEPFFTTKPRGEGTGLGLSTVHGIVKQSGGHIEVRSAPGAGTTFRIFLPALPG